MRKPYAKPLVTPLDDPPNAVVAELAKLSDTQREARLAAALRELDDQRRDAQ